MSTSPHGGDVTTSSSGSVSSGQDLNHLYQETKISHKLQAEFHRSLVRYRYLTVCAFVISICHPKEMKIDDKAMREKGED